jgi:DNA-binding transcriptional MerR regulator
MKAQPHHGARTNAAAYAAGITPRALRCAIDARQFTRMHDVRTPGGHRRWCAADVIRLALWSECRRAGFEAHEASHIVAKAADPFLYAHGTLPGLPPAIAEIRATAVHAEPSNAMRVLVAPVHYRLPFQRHAVFFRVGLIAHTALQRLHAYETLNLRHPAGS